MANPFDQFDASNNPFDQFDEVEKPKKKAGIGTAVKKSLASAGNAIESAISLPAGGLAGLLGFEEDRDAIFSKMDANRAAREKWANPDNLETSLGQDIGALALTLPAQIPALLGGAAEKGMDLVKRNEPLSRAIPATLGDAALNAAGLGPMAAAKTVLGRGAIGAVTNTSMGAGSDALTQVLATKDETKKAYDPYDPRRRVQDALIGGVTQGVMGERPKTGNKKIDAVRAAGTKKPPAPEVDVGARVFDEFINQQRTGEQSAVSFPPEGDAGTWTAQQLQKRPTMPPEAVANEGLDGQLPLFETAVEGRGISPYEAVPGDWRIDENGMPLKVDLSMDAQNMQNPLQRNLWGDELATPEFGRDPNAPLPMDRNIMGYEQLGEKVVNRTDPEAAIHLTEAIDSMGWAQKRGALKKTKMGRELPADGPMEAAKMQADIAAASGDNFKGFNAKMRKQGGGLLIGNKKVVVEATEDGFVAKIGDKEVGYLRSNITPEQRTKLGEDASVDMVKVQDDVRGKGVGTALYEAWSKANEGNVIPSGKTSPAAWKQWKRNLPGGVDKFVNQEAQRILGGADPQLILGNIPDPEVAQRVQARAALLKKQGGGVFLGQKEQVDIDNSFVKSEDGTFIPENPNIAEVLAKALAEPKDGKLWTYMQSGATSAAMKTGSAAIKAASEIVQNALKRADLNIRNNVFPAETSLRKLPKLEIDELHTLFKDEMFNGERYDGDVLAQNLSVKQLEAYRNMRDLFDRTLDVQNEARLAKGQEPISPKEAYLSSRWKGDFRRPVHDADGKLVWYLADNTKMGLESQTKALLKQFPDLVVDKALDHTVRGSQNKTDLQSMYSTMLDLLGRNDPAIEKIRQAIEDQTMAEGESSLAQTKQQETFYQRE